MNITDFKEMLGDDLKCPVCLEQLSPPVVQCKNGHNTCSKCKADCEQCPVCRGPLIETTNRLLDKILDLLFNFTVCPSAEGQNCTSAVVEDCQNKCRQLFKPIHCPHKLKCTWIGTAELFLSHVGERHLSRGLLWEGKEMKMSSQMFISVFSKGCALKVNSNNYFFYLEKLSDTFILKAKYFPFNHLHEAHFFRVTFENEDHDTIDSIILQPSADLENEDHSSISFLQETLVEEDSKVVMTALKMEPVC